jgi:hypothetical protein
MASNPKELREIQQAADAFEPRLERQFLRAMKSAQDEIELNTLALALAQKDEKLVMRVLDSAAIEDKLEPIGKTMTDAFNRGGRIGAKQVNALT